MRLRNDERWMLLYVMDIWHGMLAHSGQQGTNAREVYGDKVCVKMQRLSVKCSARWYNKSQRETLW